MKYNTMQKILPGNINFFVSSISLFAVIISMLLSIVFWSSLANTINAMILMGSIGLILDATKLCSLYYLVRTPMRSKRLITVVSLLIYLLLGFVSIIAATEVLETEIAKTTKLNLQQQTSYNILVNQLETKQHELQNLITIQTKDLHFGYRKRAAALSSKIKQADLELNNLKNKLALITSSSPNSINNFAQSLAGILHLPVAKLNNVLTLLFGCLLEIAAGFLILIKFSTAIVNQTSNKVVKKSASKKPNQLVASKHETGVDKYQVVKQAIITKSYPPKLRQIREQFNLGTAVASNYFKQLTNEGVLQKQGNKFLLCAS